LAPTSLALLPPEGAPRVVRETRTRVRLDGRFALLARRVVRVRRLVMGI
jgi:hypothetical protein